MDNIDISLFDCMVWVVRIALTLVGATCVVVAVFKNTSWYRNLIHPGWVTPKEEFSNQGPDPEEFFTEIEGVPYKVEPPTTAEDCLKLA